jgi:tryptophan-rich sensory protein
MQKTNIGLLLALIIIAQLAGVFGSFFTMPNIETWYATLIKPEFSPPNWVFAPVWIILYTLMGISAYLIAMKGIEKKNVKFALSIFGFQLAINAIWSFAFFGLQSPILGLVVIVLLWFAIIEMIILFSKISKNAAWIQIPYLLWVSFAAILNYFIVMLNP